MVCLSRNLILDGHKLVLIILTILIPLIAGSAIWLLRKRPARIHWAIATTAAFLTWLSSLLMGNSVPDSVQLSIWRPTALFPTPLELRLDNISWLLVYCSSTVLLAVFLSEAVRPSIAKARTSAIMLLFFSICASALFAGNLLTIVLAWTLFDVGTFLFLVLIQDDPQDITKIISRFALDVGGILLIVSAGVVLSVSGQDTSLSNQPLSGSAAILLISGATLRLGLFPLHFTLPPIPAVRRGMGTLLRLFPPVVALSLIARVFEQGFPRDLGIIFALLGILGFIVGGVRWVFENDALHGRPFYVLTLSGIGIFAASVYPNGGKAIAAAAALILLIGAVISLTEIHLPSHRIWPLLSTIILLGAPFSPGGVLAASIGEGLLGGDLKILSISGVLGLLLLGLGSIKVIVQELTPWSEGESRVRMIYTLGLALPVFVAIGIGFREISNVSIPGFVVFLLVLVLGVLSFLLLRRVSEEDIEPMRARIEIIDTGPLYDALRRIIQVLLDVIRSVGGVLEGEGALLWMFVIVMILVLALG